MFRRASAAAVAMALMILAIPSSQAVPEKTKVEAYKGGLSFPVDLAWVPGSRKIFFTEKSTGKIRVLNGKKLEGRACVDLEVDGDAEQGALGIALHPQFKRNHFLYVYYTNASPHEHRVTRFTVRNDRCRSPNHIVTGLQTGGGYHNGGQLEFVKGKLFVSVGEAHDPAEAQDRSSRLGKILRLNPDGTVPAGNPFGANNPVWSYGHRNPFGLAHKPGTARIYSSENGPSCDDEVNKITKGRNYGWGPDYSCGTRGVGRNPKGPIVRYRSIIVPTDLWWYRGRMKSLSGSLYMGDFGDGRLHRFVMNKRGTKVMADRIIHNADGGIVDVTKGPGGWLYFATSSAIYRIVPR
ncbi:MAG TPA: PQQ-dependent sugar dehydrogenase [Actinomycetota bacterium]|nr:PQQ-dependent sugar dehydrogenase [Actinomycetota bacterium]